MRYRVPVTVIAFGMTGIHMVRDQLPVAVRGPVNVLLTPVTIVSGFVHLLGFPAEIYESPPVVFLGNWLGWFILSLLVRAVMPAKE